MGKWVDVTAAFSEEERHYNSVYLEISEVYDNIVEVSLFSSEEGPYEIYFSYGIFHGIIYEDAATASKKREIIKKVLEEDYLNNSEPTDQFINDFAEKYNVEMPLDIFFNFM